MYKQYPDYYMLCGMQNTLPLLTAACMSVGLPYPVFDKHFEMNTTLKIAIYFP
jgi:hypothetical protein